MKKTLLLLAFIYTATIINAQVTGRSLKKVMELKMPKTADDEMPGTRGASVAWHPLKKLYYASFAGNAGYPHAVFNVTGKRISTDDLTAEVDCRGLWYNSTTKKIGGNTYDKTGWFSYTLDGKSGIPAGYTIEFEGMNQPGEQSVGAYNPVKKEVLFLGGANVHVYDAATAMEKEDAKIILHWGRTKSQGIIEEHGDDVSLPEAYNNSTIVFTGIAGAEIGALNSADKIIELYNAKTGFLYQRLKLPSDAVAELSFNFAYANGIYWLFNIEERKWIGYK